MCYPMHINVKKRQHRSKLYFIQFAMIMEVVRVYTHAAAILTRQRAPPNSREVETFYNLIDERFFQ